MKDWPTRPGDMQEIIYFFACLLPYLAAALILTLAAFLLRSWIGDTVFGITAVASSSGALLWAYLRFPAFFRLKAEKRPKILWNGRVLKFPVKSGAIRELVIDNNTRMELAYFSLRPTSTTGAQRGVWLEIRNDTERVVFTGNGDFKLAAGQTIATKKAPYSSYHEKVETFSEVILELHEILNSARRHD